MNTKSAEPDKSQPYLSEKQSSLATKTHHLESYPSFIMIESSSTRHNVRRQMSSRQHGVVGRGASWDEDGIGKRRRQPVVIGRKLLVVFFSAILSFSLIMLITMRNETLRRMDSVDIDRFVSVPRRREKKPLRTIVASPERNHSEIGGFSLTASKIKSRDIGQHHISKNTSHVKYIKHKLNKDEPTKQMHHTVRVSQKQTEQVHSQTGNNEILPETQQAMNLFHQGASIKESHALRISERQTKQLHSRTKNLEFTPEIQKAIELFHQGSSMKEIYNILESQNNVVHVESKSNREHQNKPSGDTDNWKPEPTPDRKTKKYTKHHNSNSKNGETKKNTTNWKPMPWYDDVPLVGNHTLPADFVRGYPTDPLSEKFDVSSLRRINLTNEVRHLGILLDAGRHYFPVNWIKRMIDVLSVMNYNLLHFRLTDDQAFNIQLESQPLLAYPAPLENNTKVYTPVELREIVQYAKSKGIQIVPEINVPGHSGSWAGIPDLIVQCPRFICGNGYGVPLNVSNPRLRPILKDVLKEVVDIFDRPPYLHLGGDEVNMAEACFSEVGAEMFNYTDFEQMLAEIVLEIGYNESQIIRWETSGIKRDPLRTGKIIHFWQSRPGRDWKLGQKYGKNFTGPLFLSPGLYFDTNGDDSAWEVYIKTKQLKHIPHKKSPNLGIIAATFELGTKFWLDRNVVGRLLAVSIGASNVNVTNATALYSIYKNVCKSAGFHDDLCALYGRPSMSFKPFRAKLKDGMESHVVWRQWISDICKRLTSEEKVRGYRNISSRSSGAVDRSKEKFWMTFYKESNNFASANHEDYSVDDNIQGRIHHPFQEKRLVQHSGIIMDLSSYPVDYIRLGEIMTRSLSRMGLNMVQLRLVDDFSFAYHSEVHKDFFYAESQQLEIRKFPSIQNLRMLRGMADQHGVTIMPEISISTNAGGWYQSKFNVQCPNFLCEHGRYLPQDISDPMYVPVLYALIHEILEFSSSPYLHLGYDEREASTPCFFEAFGGSSKPNFVGFERTLGKMLDFLGVTSDRVVRWENNEKVHYPGRFGDITQCHAGETCLPISESVDNMQATSWFGTVDIRQGGPWQIYSTTRTLAVQSPLAIMAKVGGLQPFDFQQDSIDYRLLAFSMGMIDDNSPKRIITQTDFEQQYIELCTTYFIFLSKENTGGATKNVSKAINHCMTFATSNEDAPSLLEANKKDHTEQQRWKEFADKICTERTQPTAKILFKNASSIPTALSMNGQVF